MLAKMLAKSRLIRDFVADETFSFVLFNLIVSHIFAH